MKQKQGFYSNLFDEEFERISIDRIKRFFREYYNTIKGK